MQWAMPSSGSSSGATNVGRRPETTSASIVLECALRWTTASRPMCASVSIATWLPCEAPLTRNQLRRAPQAAAASACACWNGVGSGPWSIPGVSAGMSSASGPLAERLDESGVGRAAALVAGDVEATGVAIGVGAQRVEIGRLGLRRRLALRRRRPVPGSETDMRRRV